MGARMMQPASQTTEAAPGAVLEQGAVEPRVVAAAEAPRAERVSWFERLKFGALRWFMWWIVRAFSLKGLYLFGRFFGTCEYAVNFKRRARYRAELKQVFPDGLSRWREQTIIRSYFRRTRCDKMLYLVFDRLPKEKILKRIRFHGREHLDAALERNLGPYVLLTP